MSSVFSRSVCATSRRARHLSSGSKTSRSSTEIRQLSVRRITTATAQVEPQNVELPPLPFSEQERFRPSQRTSIQRANIKNAKPFSEFLTDNFNRQHDYLRISLTERCNLRCLYCMPEEGIELSPQSELLTTPEIYYLSSLFVSQGVTKIRLTGGEPTVRKDIIPLMQKIGSLRANGLRELAITTNGISLHRKLDNMVEAGLTGVNLSLDTLDPFQFQIMTRRKGFEAVMKSIDRTLEMNKLGAGVKLKVNCVIMRGLNDREIIPFVELGREKDIEVRFIEYMPFDGNKWSQGKMLPYQEMLDIIRAKYPTLRKVQDHKNDTSKTFEIPGFVGRIGFITSMTHNFCGTCNRLRITSDGNLKVCLFGNTEVSLRDLMREGNNGRPIDEEAYEAIKQLEMDRQQGLVPPGTIGWAEREKQLLETIGIAVKRKKEKHAGMEDLKNMKNRPMILIDEVPHFTQQALPTSQNLGLSSKDQAQPWSRIPFHMLSGRTFAQPALRMSFSTMTALRSEESFRDHKLTHVNASGAAHMVDISSKLPTYRRAVAIGQIAFSNVTTLQLIRENGIKKGDVLSVARIAGIMAAKRTPDIIPLCHPITISGVEVKLSFIEPISSENKPSPLHWGGIAVEASVSCTGATGVEMEALTAVWGALSTVYDMCKAVDKGMRIHDVQVVLKEGGRSGRWVEDEWREAAGKETWESG